MDVLHQKFMKRAIELAMEGMKRGDGGPFGAVIVKNERIIGEGWNQVLSSNDPTAHAEVVAIRHACQKLGDFQLEDCVIYTSCEPCPMCLGAIYWARPKVLYYGCTREDAAAIAFDDDFIYSQINKLPEERTIPAKNILREEALKAFEYWKNIEKKTLY